ncbi:hypothetical protein [Sinorhizobium fredii]|uniref:hypothetical protein n=1 Tax=Rhizobium fredii TaxID=380 RepID=UPI0033917741
MSSSSICKVSRVCESSAPKRLVHQQHFRIDRQRPGNADALFHAAGKLMRAMIPGMTKPDQIDETLGALVNLLLR